MSLDGIEKYKPTINRHDTEALGRDVFRVNSRTALLAGIGFAALIVLLGAIV